MTIHKILAEETVPVSELRKNPGRYFTDRPIAVMSHNQATGYVVGAELFEKMLAIIEQNQAGKSVTGQFRPSANRLQQIIAESASYLQDATDEDLGHFSE
jgi:antitoxin YafN